ncbi:hypothetical protein ELI_3963 [Eubacterium callanderi]|uniref:Uncharacterized protein n=1 Tax=Eubacterium callanderi TaxID=53442 RepID=E3GGV2_9FIRM|nr:hypothetical protein ELI_3963 [Eubacterium callanderi]
MPQQKGSFIFHFQFSIKKEKAPAKLCGGLLF